MADRIQSFSLLLHEINSENDQSNTLTTKSKQILSDFTNIHSENCQTSSFDNNTSIQVGRRRRHAPSTLATIRRYKKPVTRKNQSNTIPIDIETLEDIQDFQQKQHQQRAIYNVRQTPLIPLVADVDLSLLFELSQQHQALNERQQRAMYNARQTPLIPLVADVDLSLLVESSQKQDHLWMDILTLINNIDDECSFFEQFRI